MRIWIIAFALFTGCSHASHPPRHFGKLPDGAAELFNTLCRDLGAHVVSDDDLSWTKETHKFRPDLLANPNLQTIYCSDPADHDVVIGNDLIADRVTHELVEVDVLAFKKRLPELEQVFLPTLSIHETVGFMHEALQLRGAESDGGWDAGGMLVAISPVSDSDKMTFYLVPILAKK